MKKFLFILLFCINLFGEERIVTLSPSINEIVFALDEGENVVANTSFCDFPPESKNIKKSFALKYTKKKEYEAKNGVYFISYSLAFIESLISFSI